MDFFCVVAAYPETILVWRITAMGRHKFLVLVERPSGYIRIEGHGHRQVLGLIRFNLMSLDCKRKLFGNATKQNAHGDPVEIRLK